MKHTMITGIVCGRWGLSADVHCELSSYTVGCWEAIGEYIIIRPRVRFRATLLSSRLSLTLIIYIIHLYIYIYNCISLSLCRLYSLAANSPRTTSMFRHGNPPRPHVLRFPRSLPPSKLYPKRVSELLFTVIYLYIWHFSF